ncbi:MAG: hypothetical protein ACXVZP_07465 [Gaiellaceae bacterium]
MHICICGWHYRHAFYESLRSVCDRFEITIVAHRPGDTLGLPTITRENRGLDWGAFSCFLDHAWDGEQDLLFLHDDTDVRDRFWDELLTIPHDQAFIFRERAGFEAAYSHGRAHFAGSRFLKLVRMGGGIWYDDGTAASTPPGLPGASNRRAAASTTTAACAPTRSWSRR